MDALTALTFAVLAQFMLVGFAWSRWLEHKEIMAGKRQARGQVRDERNVRQIA